MAARTPRNPKVSGGFYLSYPKMSTFRLKIFKDELGPYCQKEEGSSRTALIKCSEYLLALTVLKYSSQGLLNSNIKSRRTSAVLLFSFSFFPFQICNSPGRN